MVAAAALAGCAGRGDTAREDAARDAYIQAVFQVALAECRQLGLAERSPEMRVCVTQRGTAAIKANQPRAPRSVHCTPDHAGGFRCSED